MSDDEARQAILSRRARFIAATLASAGLLAGTADCGGQTQSDDSQASGGTGGVPQPCLSGGAAPCLGAPAGGGGYPSPCLAGAGGGGAYPCLAGAGGMLEDGDAPDAADAAADDGASVDGSD